jgi:hypothetical protein
LISQIVATVPYSEKQILMLDLPNGAPDVRSGTDTLAPTRVTITYAQHESWPVPHSVEVTVKGFLRDAGGNVTSRANVAEVWRYVEPEQRAAWVAQLVAENLPAWWTA